MILICPGIGKDILVIRQQQPEIAVHKHIILLAQADQLFIAGKDRILVVHLAFGMDLSVVRIDLQPRRSLRKTSILPVIPLHRRPCVIAALCVDRAHDLLPGVALFKPLLIQVQRLDIAVILHLILHVGHSELFALIDIRRSLQPVQEDRQHLCGLDPVLPVVAPA